jgi:hypothetical protein
VPCVEHSQRLLCRQLTLRSCREERRVCWQHLLAEDELYGVGSIHMGCIWAPAPRKKASNSAWSGDS